jgi:hypothetical protein
MTLVLAWALVAFVLPCVAATGDHLTLHDSRFVNAVRVSAPDTGLLLSYDLTLPPAGPVSGQVMASTDDAGTLAHTSAWLLLGSATLTTASTDLTVTWGPLTRRHLKVRLRAAGYSAATTPQLRFNGDVGTNYAVRNWDETSKIATQALVSQTGVQLCQTATTGTQFYEVAIDNHPTQGKLLHSEGTEVANAAVATAAPSYAMYAHGLWANSLAQITSITVNSGSSATMTAGTDVFVYGSN